jgi:hypothetical protein
MLKCNEGKIIRRSHIRKGKRMTAKCIRKVTPYPEAYRNFQKAQLSRMSRRLKGLTKKSRGSTLICNNNQTLRKAYVRHTKTGKRKLVKGSCITKRGSSNRKTAKKIGPLRKGDLKQYGYQHIIGLSLKKRHQALKQAVAKYGSLSVWKKINVLYIFFKNTNPELSKLYNEDRTWVKETYGLKAFF